MHEYSSHVRNLYSRARSFIFESDLMVIVTYLNAIGKWRVGAFVAEDKMGNVSGVGEIIDEDLRKCLRQARLALAEIQSPGVKKLREKMQRRSTDAFGISSDGKLRFQAGGSLDVSVDPMKLIEKIAGKTGNKFDGAMLGALKEMLK